MDRPTISVITPSYNQARFIRATIQSVLTQEFPGKLEYIVIDGGSSDGSVDIIRGFAPQLSYWESERDRGQSHAINKGISRASGDILCWLNSDDRFTPGALAHVLEIFQKNPNANVVVGGTRFVDAEGKHLVAIDAACGSLADLFKVSRPYQLHQPSIFWRSSIARQIGPLDESQHLVMDYDYWVRMRALGPFHVTGQILSETTRHSEAKTAGNFRAYRKAQVQYALKKFGFPFSLRDWPVRATLYWHILLLATRVGLQKLGLFKH